MLVFQFGQKYTEKPSEQSSSSFQEQKQAALQSVISTAKNLENLRIPLPTIPKISEATTSDQINKLMTTFYKDVQQQIQRQMEQKPEQFTAILSSMSMSNAQVSLSSAIDINRSTILDQISESESSGKISNEKANELRKEITTSSSQSKNIELEIAVFSLSNSVTEKFNSDIQNIDSEEKKGHLNHEIAERKRQELTTEYNDRMYQIYNAKSSEDLYKLANQWGYNDLQKQVNSFISQMKLNIAKLSLQTSTSASLMRSMINSMTSSDQRKQRAESISKAIAGTASIYSKSESAKLLASQEKSEKTLAAFAAKREYADKLQKFTALLQSSVGDVKLSPALAESAFKLALEFSSGKVSTSSGEKTLPAMSAKEIESAIQNSLGVQQQSQAPQSDLGKIRFVKTHDAQ